MDCPENCGCKVTMHRNEEDIQRVWKAINRMIGWVIVSSGSIVLWIGITLVRFILSRI